MPSIAHSKQYRFRRVLALQDRSTAGGTFPAVADVGCLLLVSRPIGKADRTEASRLVEAAGAGVGLKAPQFERIDPAFLRNLDQQCGGTPADAIRARMEEAHLFTLPRQKGNDAAAVFGNDDFAILEDDVSDESAILCHRMQHRQER